MDKKIIVKEFTKDEHECCGGEHHHRPHHHKNGERRQRHVRIHRPEKGKKTTKLMTSKEELVTYVNELGEKGHHIDVYKIEDGLYKVVVKHVMVHDEEIEVDLD